MLKVIREKFIMLFLIMIIFCCGATTTHAITCSSYTDISSESQLRNAFNTSEKTICLRLTQDITLTQGQIGYGGFGGKNIKIVGSKNGTSEKVTLRSRSEERR